MKSYLLGAVAALAVAGTANAAELLTNGSFELPNIGTSNYSYPAGYGNPPVTYANWTWNSTALVNASGYSAWYGNTPPVGQDGAQFAALQGTGTIAQTFTASNTKATLSWLAGGRPFYGASNGDQTYQVKLGSDVLGTYSTVSSQAFGANSLNLTGLTVGQSYTLTYAGQIASDETAFIDKVSVLGVPEPASWALMIGGFGFAGLAARRRRTNIVFA